MVNNAWFPNYEHCPERPPVLSMLMFIALTHVTKTKTEGKKKLQLKDLLFWGVAFVTSVLNAVCAF